MSNTAMIDYDNIEFRDDRTKFVFLTLINLATTDNETAMLVGTNGEHKWVKYFGEMGGVWAVLDHPEQGYNELSQYIGFAGVPLYVYWHGAISAAVKELGGFDQIEEADTEYAPISFVFS